MFTGSGPADPYCGNKKSLMSGICTQFELKHCTTKELMSEVLNGSRAEVNKTVYFLKAQHN